MIAIEINLDEAEALFWHAIDQQNEVLDEGRDDDYQEALFRVIAAEKRLHALLMQHYETFSLEQLELDFQATGVELARLGAEEPKNVKASTNQNHRRRAIQAVQIKKRGF